MMATELAPWRERNPLRRWRLTAGISVADAALLVGVSINTLTKWEAGGGTPAPERMTRLAAVTRNKRFEKEWNAWQKERLAA